MADQNKTNEEKMEFFIESDMSLTFKDICAEIMETYIQREQNYRDRVLDLLVDISKYEMALIAPYILKDSKWQDKSYLDIMAGEGLTTSIFFNALLKFSENQELTFNNKIKAIDSLIKAAESDNGVDNLFNKVKASSLNLVGVEANHNFAETARKSGIYGGGVVEAVLPCERLGLPLDYNRFDYGWIFSQSLAHICGSDGDKIRQYMFEQIRGLINDRNPDARFFFDHIALENFRNNEKPVGHNLYRRDDSTDESKNNYTYVRMFSSGEIHKLAKDSWFEVERQVAINLHGENFSESTCKTVFTLEDGFTKKPFEYDTSIVLNILKPI